MLRLTRFLVVWFVLVGLALVPGPAAPRAVRAAATGGPSTVIGGTYTYLVVDNARHRLYASLSNGTVGILDTTKNAFIKWVSVGSNPRGMDLAFNASELFVSVTGTSTLAVINLTTDTVARSFHLPFSPGDLAAGRPGRAYLGNQGGWTYVEMVDTDTGKFLGDVTAPGQYYQDPVVRTSRDRSTLYTVERWSAPTSIAATSVATDHPTLVSASPWGIDSVWDMYPSPDGTRMFYPNPAAYLIQDFFVSNWTEGPHLNTGPYPYSVSLSDYGTIAFGTAATQTTLFAFNATGGALLTTFPLSGDPQVVRSTEDATKAFVISSAGLEIVATGFTGRTWPIPEPAVLANATAGFAPLAVSFWSTVMGGTPPYNETWTFGDGAMAYVANPTHMYAAAGTYATTLTVRDAKGATGNETVDVRVAVRPLASPLAVSMTLTGISFDPNTNPWVPPDPQVAAGLSAIVEMVNTRYAVFSRDGVLVGGGPLSGLFNVTSTDFLTDPRVQFDPFTDRFFATVDDLSRASVLIGVSSPLSTTAPWQVSALRSATACPDQPFFGLSLDVLVVTDGGYSSCTTSGVYVGGEYWIVNKTSLLLGTVVARHFGPDASLHTLFPVQPQDASTGLYLATVGWAWSPTATLRVAHVTGAPPGAVAFANRTYSVRTINQPPNAPQPGTTLDVNTGDARVQSAFLRDGMVWMSLGDECFPAGSPTNSSCARVIEVDTSASKVVQDFEVSDPVSAVFYPALSEDGAGDVFVAFGASSTSTYAGTGVTVQIAGDLPNTTRALTMVGAGSGPALMGCDATSCRFGDYFGVSPDPLDPDAVWIVGEDQGASWWQTTVAQVGVYRPATLTLSYAVTNGGGNVNPAPTVTLLSGGLLKVLPLSTSPNTFAADQGSPWVVSPLVVASATERWIARTLAFGLAANGTNEVVSFEHQFFVTLRTNPARGGTLSPGSGWYNATSVLSVAATPAAGWKLDYWTGSGSGSYTGTSETAALNVSAAITETASFYPGLTITAGPGGSVTYEYANVSGIVPAGTTAIVYVPPGSTVRLTATPDSLDTFSAWSGNYTGPVLSISLNVTGPASVQAGFSFSATGLATVGAGVAIVVVVAAVLVVLLLRRRKTRPSPPPPPPGPPTAVPPGGVAPPEVPKEPGPPGGPPP